MTTSSAVLPNVYGILPNVSSKGSALSNTVKTRVCRTFRTLPNLLGALLYARAHTRTRTRSA